VTHVTSHVKQSVASGQCCLLTVQVESEDIERFEEEYRGSEEELKDLKDLYTRFKGDMKL